MLRFRGRKPSARIILSKAAIATLLALQLSPAFLGAQAGQISPEKRVQLENAISRFMAANGVPGVSVAVVENGAFEWSAGFGTADLENFVPATSRTLYRLASISKPITATAAMLLWQQGKLDLDAPIQKYCPAFPLKDAPITTRELLGHLGGIRHYKKNSPDDLESFNVKTFLKPDPGWN